MDLGPGEEPLAPMSVTTELQERETQQRCPRCGASVPVDDRYPIWCDSCNWNVQPRQPAPPRTVLESLYTKLNARVGRNLHEQLLHATSLRPTMTVSRLLGFTLAGAVHVLTLVTGGVGVLLLVRSAGNGLILSLGLLCLFVVWLVRPRLGRLRDAPAPRTDFPALYSLANRVASNLGTAPVDAIVLTGAYNAYFRRVGWRHRAVLGLGLPLLSVLDEQETVALIAHELAHAINGDATRSLFVGSAISSLSRWYRILYPLRLALSLGFYELAYLWMLGLNHLLWRDKQRAEYLADHCSARVAGTAAALSALDKLHLDGIYAQAVRYTAAQPAQRRLIAVLRQSIALLPRRERERLRRVQRLEASRLDSTHPPTAYRIALLEAHAALPASVSVAPEAFAAITRELATAEYTVQERLIEAYLKAAGR